MRVEESLAFDCGELSHSFDSDPTQDSGKQVTDDGHYK